MKGTTMHINRNHRAVNFSIGRQGRKVDTIVIHHWDDPAKNPHINGVINWFESQRSGTSAHYVVQDGAWYEMVHPDHTAWHAGNWDMNLRSIGIECNPRCSDGDKRAVADLIKYLRTIYGNIRIIGHQDVSSTGCPGRYYPPAQVLAPYLNGVAPSAGTPSGGKNVSVVVDEVIAGKWGNGEDRVSRLTSAGYDYQTVQNEVNRKLATPSPKPAPAPSAKSLQEIAREVWAGKWGNGEDRRIRLERAGYNYEAVQTEVNRVGNGGVPTPHTPRKSVSQIADEVIRGDWGNGDDRRVRLERAGHNYSAVQAEVNRKLGY